MLGTAGHFLFILAFQARAGVRAHAVHLHADRMGDACSAGRFFGQFPDVAALVGMAIIAGSGLLLTWHERRRALATRPPEPTAID